MRQKELRIALVCYGGVSLAIYMHGVTRELWQRVTERGDAGIVRRTDNVLAAVTRIEQKLAALENQEREKN